MGKSDDSITRRKNKRKIKKQENKSKGMCFSLPTPVDPFNDRGGKPEPTRKKKKDSKPKKKLTDKKVSRLKKGSFSENDIQERGVAKFDNLEIGNSAFVNSFSFMGTEIVVNLGKPTCKIIKRDGSTHSCKEYDSVSNTDCPSKYLIMCLNSIQNTLQHSEDLSSIIDKPLFANTWGLEFWTCYTNRKDVLETGGSDSTVEQISWIASTAADTISMKEKEGVSFAGPFLLYLVPSQHKAHKVRHICKPLKSLGIHAVSLHSGASVDHQIHGLKSCEPEFLISTPERLLELLSLKALDISGISLLVIDGLKAPFKGSYFDEVKSIRQFISGNLRTVVLCDCANISSKSVVQKLLGEEELTCK